MVLGWISGKLALIWSKVHLQHDSWPFLLLALGNSRKYPYPTTDGFHVLTPLAFGNSRKRYPPPMPSEFHNREPPLPFGIYGVFLEVHFRLGNVYMNKRRWIYASPRLWSSGARRQALLFSDKKNLLTACGQAFFKSKFGYKKTPVTVIFLLFVFLCCFEVHRAK